MNQHGFGQQQGSHGGMGGSGGTSYGQGHSTSSFGQHDQGGFGSQGGQHQQGQGGGYGGQYGFNQGGQMGGMSGMGGMGGMGSSMGGGMGHMGGGGMGAGMGGQHQQQGRDFQLNPHTMDKDYNLVSVLYHALQAADTCARYCEDARREGSPEIAHFMEQVQQQNLQISQRAKELLFKQRQI